MYIMSKPKLIIVKETVKELKKLQTGKSSLLIKRLNMLIELRKNGLLGVSKRQLAKTIGVDPNTIQSWRTLYLTEGIDGMLKHGRIGFKPSVFTKQEHAKIENKLSKPKNTLRGYKQLMTWINTELDKKVKYTTVVEYSKRHFGTKIKVARKSHVKKDDEKGETFKKTSGKPSKM